MGRVVGAYHKRLRPELDAVFRTFGKPAVNKRERASGTLDADIAAQRNSVGPGMGTGHEQNPYTIGIMDGIGDNVPARGAAAGIRVSVAGSTVGLYCHNWQS
jgi:hypothetical protein